MSLCIKSANKFTLIEPSKRGENPLKILTFELYFDIIFVIGFSHLNVAEITTWNFAPSGYFFMPFSHSFLQ